jgi:hypothetical protein
MELYIIACVNDSLVAVRLDLSSGSLLWNVSFIRMAHDWVVDGCIGLFLQFVVFL